MPAVPFSYRDLYNGLDVIVPLLNGSQRCYVNLDNAASTPPLKAVESAVARFMTYYSSVHRGTGFKSQLATHLYEEARLKVIRFLGGSVGVHTCIFGKNTTEMVNRLALRFPFTEQKNVVLVSMMEHHSNDLPWRGVAQVLHCNVLPDGRLDEAHFDALLEQYRGRLALVAISGASNVTGYINPIHRLAEKAHAAGAQIMVDCAQLAPHRRVNMGDPADPAHLDYVVISAHKMYAPYGTGALVGLRDIFERGMPDHRGGGQVEFVTENEVAWTGAPERDEAGSPNTAGAVALAAAISQLEVIGMDAVAAHEAELTEYALRKLPQVPGLHLFGSSDPAWCMNRVGVIPMQLEGIDHFLVGAILGYEFGIGVRNGCFCAHPYLLRLLGVTEAESLRVRSDILSGNRANMPGLVRASFGLYNTTEDVDALVDALNHIARKEFTGKYHQNNATGEYLPEGWNPHFKRYFRWLD
ncbi:MAG: aminotransferase class V-fold PLP-dependent enzyme [Anaerolineae bacterium]|nr:aminotransferase class V-fold PLP-dependent enzyme [Anaerolineae bacterium]